MACYWSRNAGIVSLGGGLALVLMILPVSAAFLPPQNPPWPATYNMSLSTICMAGNDTDWLDLDLYGKWGIVSIDWANARNVWAQQQPMDCEERLLAQAQALKARNPETKVFVYRNLVKALNWFTSVRQILDDGSFSSFFLPFGGASGHSSEPLPGPFHVPPCTTQKNLTQCSNLYHDQEQTPAFVTPENPSPGIPCYIPCNCGSLPCGEYLFDHRNPKLISWLLKYYILSPTALGSPAISGLFIDDFWCSLTINTTQECNDPVAGPSEIDPNSQEDMSLSNHSLHEITKGWLENMEVVQQAIIDAGGYTWSLMPGQQNANANPVIVNSTNCIGFLRNATEAPEVYFMFTSVVAYPSSYEQGPLLSGLTYNSTLETFPWLEQQLVAFLLMRGPYAYIGWGEWGMWWPTAQVPLPKEVWEADPGEPLEASCREIEPGVFQRHWSKWNVTLNCNTWQASF